HERIGTDPSRYSGIPRWATRPDDHALKDPASAKIDPFGVHEKQLHFIDVELFLKGNAKREYRPDLSGKPNIDDFPHDMHDPRYLQAGMLPLRVEYCYGKLVEAIKSNRMTDGTDKLEG